MKFLFAILAVVGFAAAAPATLSLETDLLEFVALLPIGEMKEISQKYLNNDAEVQQVVAYLQSEEWAKLVEAVGEKPVWKEFEEYMKEAGFPIDDIIQLIHDLLQGAQPEGKATSTRGMRQYVDEIIAVIPVDELLALLQHKLETSEEFKAFWAEVSDEKAHSLFEEVRAMKEVQRLAGVLKLMGIDMQKVVDIIYMLFGWK